MYFDTIAPCHIISRMTRILYTSEFKNRARALRQNGLSYKEIADRLHLAKSTVKLWCGDIELNPEHKKRLYTKQIEILSKGPKSSHERRMRAIEQIVKSAANEIKLPINPATYKLFGAALYWAEGDKTNQFSISNSDPLLISFISRWICTVFKTAPANLKAYLNIYPQQNDNELKKFWSNITGIPLENFGKSFVKPPNKGYKKNNLYYGTIKIRLIKGTDMRHRVFGWIKSFLENTQTNVDAIETKWHKLKTGYTRP